MSQESTIASVLVTQIERIVHPPNFRGTRYAVFQRPDGWFICDAWFEDGEPRMQIRSSAHSLKESAIIMAGIQMAQDWIITETAAGGNVPRKGIKS